MTFQATGLYPALSAREDLTVIDTYDKSIGARDMLERRRQALLADLFITGTNAVTEKGQLVNLDMIGNRVAALTFGPRFVLLFIGRNKLVEDVPAAHGKDQKLHRADQCHAPGQADALRAHRLLPKLPYTG